MSDDLRHGTARTEARAAGGQATGADRNYSGARPQSRGAHQTALYQKDDLFIPRNDTGGLVLNSYMHLSVNDLIGLSI